MSQDTEPHRQLNKGSAHEAHLWDEPTTVTSAIPEPLYRLRISVVKDSEGQDDAPSKIFAFETYNHLLDACDKFRDTFGRSELSGYKIEKSGLSEVSEGGEGIEDGRTMGLTVEYDSVAADESWGEFLSRLSGVEKPWVRDAE